MTVHPYIQQPVGMGQRNDFRVFTKQIKKIRFEPKITETGSVSQLFRFIFETNENLVSVCFGVSNVFGNNRNKQFCFKMNQNKPKMDIETTETYRFVSKWTKTNQKCTVTSKQLKQTDLFKNEPKQTKNVLKNIKTT